MTSVYTVTDVYNSKCEGLCTAAKDGLFDGGVWVKETYDPMECDCYQRNRATDLGHRVYGLPKRSKTYHHSDNTVQFERDDSR
jgi:hypothetical protein